MGTRLRLTMGKSKGKEKEKGKGKSSKKQVYGGPKYLPHHTDCFFLLLFIAFLVGVVIIFISALGKGDLDRLVRGVDMYGNKCGIKNTGKFNNVLDLTDKPSLVFPNPLRPSISYCETSCPCTKDDAPCPDVDFDNPDYSRLLCPYQRDGSPVYANGPTLPIHIVTFSPEGKCYWWFNTRTILNRCIPTGSEFFVATGSNATVETDGTKLDNLRDTSTKILGDVNETKYWLFLLAGAALVLGFIWLVLLTYFAGCMVWSTIIIIFLAAVAVTAAIATLVILLLILFFCSRIKVAVRIIKEAARAVGSMPGIILFPFVTIALLVGMGVFFLFGWLVLGTVAEEVGDSDGNYKGTKSDRTLQGMQIYWIFGFFWVYAFILAMSEMSFAQTFTRWYYAPKKGGKSAKGVGSCTIWGSWFRVLWYHLGTVAFGSLILAIVLMIRATIYFISKNLEKYKGNSFVDKLLKCFQCCMSYVQRFIEFINRNAYIVTSITGYLGFCGAAKKAYNLLTQNALLLIAVSGVAEFLIFLGKLFIVVVVVIIAVLLFREDEDLNYWTIPVIIAALLAYAIATAFLSLFNMAVDSIFVCFCFDVAFATANGKDEDEVWPHTSPHLNEFITKFAEPKGEVKMVDAQ